MASPVPPTIDRPAPRPTGSGLLARARELTPLIRDFAAEAERAGRVAGPVHNALLEAGFYRMTVDAAIGGADLSLPEILRILEVLGQADGSVGWTVLASCAVPAMGAFLPEEGAKELLGPARSATSSSVAGMGKAVAANGGYVVSGRWSFVSGCSQSTAIGLICSVFDGETARPGEGGGPFIVFAVVPVERLTIIEDWETTGLRGTGSFDVEVDSVFVPAADVVDFSKGPRPGLSLVHYQNVETAANVASAAVAVGIAAAAIETFAALAPRKAKPAGGTLADTALAKLALARADARLQQARGYLYETVDAMWEEILGGTLPGDEWVARTSIAASTTVEACIEVASSLYRAAGASAVRSGCLLDRCLRDLYTLGAHIMVQQENLVLHGGSLFAR